MICPNCKYEYSKDSKIGKFYTSDEYLSRTLNFNDTNLSKVATVVGCPNCKFVFIEEFKY